MSGTSSTGPAPDTLELAALLCSRVCHDLISPVGAIVNGLEVLDDNPKPEDREFALDLIRKSAKTASARLQFFLLCSTALVAQNSSDRELSWIKQLFENGQWQEITNHPPHPGDPSDLYFYYGAALARLQRWDDEPLAAPGQHRRSDRRR